MTDLLSQSIDQEFDDAFFTGTSVVSRDVPNFYQVSLDGHGYVIEPSKYQRVTVPLQRQSTDESVEPGEQTLNTGGAWRRSQDNWFLGSGQEYLDNRFAFVSVYTHSGEDPSVRTRFWRSKGVDPWGFGALSLLPEQERKKTCTTTPIVCTVGPYLYLWDGATVYYSADPTEALPTWTAVTAPAGSGAWPHVHGVSTDGTRLYLACGTSGVCYTTAGTSTAHYLRETPTAPAVSQKGTGGSTHYTYALVGRDANGYATLVSSFTTITNGNATLTTANYIEVTWDTVTGVATWDLLRGTSSHAIAVGLTGNSFTDDGSNSLQSYTAPTATTENLQATFVAYGNSFLIAAAGAQLVEVNGNGSTLPLLQHRNSSFRWRAGCGSNVAIYAAGAAGNVSELYGIQLSTATFGLGAPYIAGQVPLGEIINDLCYYEGLVVVATSLGVRAMQDTNSDGHLTSGPVITDLGPSNTVAPYGSFVWFGISNFEESDGIWPGIAESSGTGRLYLSEFTTTALLPAYATDVLADDGVNSDCTSVAIWNGVPYFAISGDGVWGPESNGNLVEQGYLESGWVRYGTVEDKILVSTDVRHDPLAGSVQIDVVPFGSQSFLTVDSNEPGSIGPSGRVSAGNYVGEAFNIIPVLSRTATTPTKGPVLRRWTVRAMVVAVRQDQIVCPIIWNRNPKTPIGDGAPAPLNLEEEWDFLQGLVQSGKAFLYQEGSKTYTAYIDQIELDGQQWTDQKSMLMGILSVKMLTVN